ncbi:cholecystokinin receptor type A-like [Asterias rubens]|uniref:cholecystokinin receptor type A-like n=1 Tax=Asterias rubens TaxID=7604 RepID=UPI0014553E2A|nr:cholecystokinin receptor type A-like [Asterias rubens]
MADINATNVDMRFLYVDKLEYTRWAVFTLWLVIFLIGVPGNLMIVAVYWASGIKTSTHVLIGSLAVADLLMCLLKFADAIVIASVPFYLAYNRESSIYFLSNGLLYSTALLTTAIAFDRFDAVCRSLRRTMTLRRAKIVSALCFIIGFIGIIPELVHKIQTDRNGGVDTFEQAIVKAIPLSIYGTSLLIVTVSYSGIFVFLRKRGRVESRDVPAVHHGVGLSTTGASVVGGEGRTASIADNDASDARGAGTEMTAIRMPDVGGPPRSSINGVASTSEQHLGTNRPNVRRPGGTNQFRITRMLLITTLTFFILWFPIVLLKVYALGTLFTDFQKSHHYANLVSALLVLRDTAFVNSVINVFIYSVANKRFLLESKRVVKNIRARFG